ncbi:3'-5' exonuclease [Marivita hallyeonensis]|uniref:DNA-directed DNA polymerase n=1 Tax=Marivita hallyeonensis TaxID=996342 RepID=A0A1M5PKI1_9RHOB|nr:exonuclease domain-containing protein [Marivita hallyeonensis]SHH02251.1 DNA polymerase-3 subunit epsilon [Marivita hallyeonensis]
MLAKLSLRLRIFLFFCLLGLGGLASVGVSLWFGYARAMDTTVANGFTFAAILSAFLVLALTVTIWLLFDENVAKPIERLASEMRTRAHAGVDREMDASAARYLGDLAPAACAVTKQLNETALSTAQTVAAETARLKAEKARLTALLSEVPVATILVNADGQIVLYDGQAAEVLAQLGVPRLNAQITEYFEASSLEKAVANLQKTGKDVAFEGRSNDKAQSFDVKLKPMDGGGYLMVIDSQTLDIAPDAARPLVYDFDLLERRQTDAEAKLQDRPIRDLCFSVFDTETTGLLPHKDDIVQLGAVRVLNGRIIEGEQINQLVDPGRPIPPASTKVHKVTDAMVQGQPDIRAVAKRFHAFSRDAVIVAHNAPFDMAFLHRHAKDSGVTWDHPILDTVLLSAVLFGASETHTLDALCERLNVTIPTELRHTALGDAQATAEVLVRMLPMLDARGLKTFGQVIEETRRHGRLLEDLN